jgi:GNAT superfamily N-acetyltransferase
LAHGISAGDADGRDLQRSLLDRAANAFPAAVDDSSDGWRLRYADGSTWWASAVLAHAATGERSLDERVCGAEQFYARFGAPARFQVCPGCPPELDEVLARRGYRVEAELTVLVAAAHRVAELTSDAARGGDRQARPRLTVRSSERPDPMWFAVWHAVHAVGYDPEPEWRLLRRVRQPSRYVMVRFDDGEAVAVGRAVAEAGWTGVFAMATLPTARRRGAARAVLSALAGWAAQSGAPRLYLQLEADPVARRLYTSAGFADLFSYHYRRAA